MTTPTSPRTIADLDRPLPELEAAVKQLAATRTRAGLLAEQRHQYLDLDVDSACTVPGSSCPSCLPAGSPDWRTVA